MDELTRRIEAILHLAPRPVSRSSLASACCVDEGAVGAALDELGDEYAERRHGLELREVAGGLQLVVATDCEDAITAFAGAREVDDLSPALLETVAVVAYLQPTTRAEVARIRGVSSEWALAALEERGLVEERGRAETPGAPLLYGTTDRFLELFGLTGTDTLPALEGFAPDADDVEELRARLLANAERRTP